MYRRVLIAGLGALAACRPAEPSPQFVTQWARVALAAAQGEGLDAPVASRVSAYAAIALYEGYAADPRSRLLSLAGQLNGLWNVPAVEAGETVDGATVAAEAARTVLDTLFKDGASATLGTINTLAVSQFESRHGGRVRDAVRDRSVSHGRALGHAILAWAAADGFAATRKRAWRAPGGESRWGSAAGARPMEPHWGALRPFAIRNADECAPPTPPAYSLRAGTEFWKMGRELYDSARSLSEEQAAIAHFWADSAALAAPGAHWIALLSQVLERPGSSADRAAEAHMLMAVILADAFIGASREQYRSLVVRPVTYANRAFDRRWTPVSPTLPFPAYPSTGASLSAAAGDLLRRFFGDSTAFTDSTRVMSSAMARTFRTLSEAVDEAAIAHIYGGVDYPLAVKNGRSLGQCVAERVRGRLRTRPAPG